MVIYKHGYSYIKSLIIEQTNHNRRPEGDTEGDTEGDKTQNALQWLLKCQPMQWQPNGIKQRSGAYNAI